MNPFDYWRLNETFTINQAAFLIVGEDPAYERNWMDYDREPEGYSAVLSAIQGAVRKGVIKSSPANGENTIDLLNDYIEYDDIKKWLKSKGFYCDFFFPSTKNDAPYLNENHPQYALKLAIAIKAWEEVTQNPYLLKNKTPKKALETWLENNATKYDLAKQAIEDIAKISNWNTKGGAPSTWSKAEEVEEVEELDDAIPF